MGKQTFGTLFSILAVSAAIGLSGASPASADADIDALMMQRGMDRAAAADATGPQSVGKVSGKFRIKGKVNQKTSGITGCYCTVYFNHDNLVGGDYYTYGRKEVNGDKCNMEVPFTFTMGDTGRPVVVSVTSYCNGPLYRYHTEDLPDIPLKKGKSKVVEFEFDM